ncbi:MAG: hypothetical protein Q4B67_08030 [Eubacteriales bacterium]|nr:hypothetical protein [Eubacteriales bacterium]
MNVTVNIGWKFVAAAGVAISAIILACKGDAPAAERVLTNSVSSLKAIDTLEELWGLSIDSLRNRVARQVGIYGGR